MLHRWGWRPGTYSMMTAFLVTLLLFMSAMSVAAQKVTITHFHDPDHTQTWRDWLEVAKEKFEAENPDIEIELLYPADRNDQLDKIVSMYAANVLPDVIETFSATGYQFGADGIFRDLNPYMERDSELDWSEFFPSAVDAAEIVTGPFTGGRFFLATSIYTTATVYNLNRFAESGMAAPSEFDHHWTWDEFKELATKLTRRDAEGEVAFLGASIPLLYAWRWGNWVHNAGGFYYDRYVQPTEVTFNDPAVITTLEFLQELHHDLGVIEDRGHGAFWRGEAAIFVDGPSYTANHHDAGANFDYAFGYMPMLERGGSETLPIGVAMGSQTQHPDEAWRWMKYLATEAAYDHIALTSRPPAWDQAARQFVDYFPNPSPWEHVWIETLMHPDTYFRPVVPSRVQDEMTTYVEQVLNGEMSPAAAIATMQDTGSAILREIWAGRE